MRKVEFKGNVPIFAWIESVKPFWTKLRTPNRDSTLDLSVIGNLVQQDSDASEHCGRWSRCSGDPPCGEFHHLMTLCQDVKIWAAFGTGKTLTHHHNNAIYEKICRDISPALLVFHSFKGCDTASAFFGRSKKFAWEAWNCYPDVTHNIAYSNAMDSFVLIDSSQLTSDSQHLDLDTDDEDSCPPTRCLPDRLETISRATKFTKDEIRYVYRAFKTECPSGIISEATFKSIYAKFFPLGDSSQYAHYVFTNLDKGHTGIITFRDFMFGMSVVMKGSLQERLRWAFSLYDINHDGFITRQELLDVISAIYSLLGDSRDRPKKSTLVHKLDLNNDGVITIDEFIHYCSRLFSLPHSPLHIPSMSNNQTHVSITVVGHYTSRGSAVHTVAVADMPAASTAGPREEVYDGPSDAQTVNQDVRS
uniref:EF-hand domain-containing protein n=1 Tax=Timema poppense TaxID=170557 RepID=A0A7R9D6N9_TIMPO|nr:unnamed protein product [Timema poppensis]